MAVSVQGVALGELYTRHRAALIRFLTRMLRCEETAADVAHDAFLRILRYAPRSMDDSRAYLFQVAANAARDHMARERTRSTVIKETPAPEMVACPRPDPEAEALAQDRLRVLAEAVEDLPPRCREVFLMSRFNGLSNGEIADVLGISRNMVEKHIIKAMLHCRRRLGINGS